jgi:UDP-3-O-[3-hydroxymyristoyl] N-acetylglucosamine deacetylase
VDRARQATIGVAVELKGIGLHSGRPERMVLRPAPADTGIFFRREAHPGRAIRATLAAVTDTAGAVTLGGSDGVRTVEHLLSAAWAFGVSNMEVELDGGEVPGMDGSALPILRALQEGGLRPQEADRPLLRLREPAWVGEGGSWAVALPSPRFVVACVVTLDAPRSEDLAATYDPDRDRYEEDIAPARTWGYERDAEGLRRRGMALGASLDNTLVIGGRGFLNPPRFPNEPARHKVLDAIGDLALLGCDLQAYVITVRAGHRLHIALAKALRAREG